MYEISSFLVNNTLDFFNIDIPIGESDEDSWTLLLFERAGKPILFRLQKGIF